MFENLFFKQENAWGLTFIDIEPSIIYFQFLKQVAWYISSKLQRIQITRRIVKIGPFWTYSEERSLGFYIETMHIIFLLQRSVRYKVNKPKATSSKGTTQPRQHCQKCFHQSVQTQCSRFYHHHIFDQWHIVDQMPLEEKLKADGVHSTMPPATSAQPSIEHHLQSIINNVEETSCVAPTKISHILTPPFEMPHRPPGRHDLTGPPKPSCVAPAPLNWIQSWSGGGISNHWLRNSAVTYEDVPYHYRLQHTELESIIRTKIQPSRHAHDHVGRHHRRIHATAPSSNSRNATSQETDYGQKHRCLTDCTLP